MGTVNLILAACILAAVFAGTLAWLMHDQFNSTLHQLLRQQRAEQREHERNRPLAPVVPLRHPTQDS